MRMKKLMSLDAKQIDLVYYLAVLGHRTQKIRNNDYWHLSSLHKEKTPSFKVK
jgi:DNA primase